MPRTRRRNAFPNLVPRALFAPSSGLAGTHVIVFISKPFVPFAASHVLETAAKASKPAAIAYLGTDPLQVRLAGLTPAANLEDAAPPAAETAQDE